MRIVKTSKRTRESRIENWGASRLYPLSRPLAEEQNGERSERGGRRRLKKTLSELRKRARREKVSDFSLFLESSIFTSASSFFFQKKKNSFVGPPHLAGTLLLALFHHALYRGEPRGQPFELSEDARRARKGPGKRKAALGCLGKAAGGRSYSAFCFAPSRRLAPRVLAGMSQTLPSLGRWF